MAPNAWSASLECLFRDFQPPSDTTGKTFILVMEPSVGEQVSTTVLSFSSFLACARA